MYKKLTPFDKRDVVNSIKILILDLKYLNLRSEKSQTLLSAAFSGPLSGFK